MPDAKVTAKNNLAASFLESLRQLGVVITPAIKAFADHGAQQQWSGAYMMQAFRQTKAYAQSFPGIPHGMTEAQYISSYRQLQQKAQDAGVNLSKSLFGAALQKQNSISEIGTKLEAIHTLKTNAGLFGEFENYLKSKGHKGVDRGNMLKFVMRKGSLDWEQEWNTVVQAQAIEQTTGLNVGPELGKHGKPIKGSADFSYKFLQGLQKHMLPGQEPNYQALGQALAAIPEAHLYGMGLTKKDAARLAYGSPQAPKIAQKIQRAVATYSARLNIQPTGPTQQGGSVSQSMSE